MRDSTKTVSANVKKADPERSDKKCRSCVGILLALALVTGGTVAGAIFASRRKSAESAEGAEKTEVDEYLERFQQRYGNGGISGETEETSEMVGANKNIATQKIVRENRFYGLSYSQFGLGDNRLCPPYNGDGYQCLLRDQVEADIRLISTMTNRIRTYSLVCEASIDKMLEYCDEHDIEVMLGVWVSNSTVNALELKRLEAVLEKFGKKEFISSIVVGNEAVFAENGASVDSLADVIEEVRELVNNAGSKASIGTAEIYNVWNGIKTDTDKPGVNMTRVVNAVDWIGLNSHPFYANIDPENGNGGIHVRNERAAVSNYWGGKPVRVTETGFPTRSGGPSSGGSTSTPSNENLERFAEQMEIESRANDIPVYFFEPFDGDWKRRWIPLHEADYSWGLYNCDRTLKNIKLPSDGAV